MKNSDQISRLVLLVLLAMWILCAPFITATVVATGSQAPQKPEEAVKPLIVMITSQFADGPESGAGIIFGQANDRLYIATANHVVRKGVQEARPVQVEFKWLPGEAIEAMLLSDVNSDLDLAVLAVANVDRLNIPADVLRFDQLGDPSSLKLKDAVYLIGNRDPPWRINVMPDKVFDKSDNSIFFETTHLDPGYSGGALLNEKYEVVGMIRAAVSGGDGEAVNIQNVLNSLTKWGYQVNLKRKAAAITSQAQEPPVEVPNFRGLTEAEARRQLSRGVLFAELSPGEITYQDSNKTPGTVIDQSPAPRSKVRRGTAVNLVIARPQRPPLRLLLPMIVEIESLLPRMKASAGELTRQEMAGFGPGWGANAQVFWRPPPPVGVPIRNYPHVRFSIDVAEAGTYGVTLVHTQAPDYGNARVFVRGTPRGDLAGYAPTVRTARVALSDIQLDAGVNEVVVTVLGKAAASTGFFVGLDRIELMRR
jgi:S1-C subfamily serine protease